MGRPRKTVPLTTLKSLVGRTVTLKTESDSIKGKLISADTASIFVMVNDTKTNLRVDELKSIAESADEQDEE